MKPFLVIVYTLCFFVAFMVYLQSLNNAFKKNILWGGIFLLFPVGTYFYYKRFIIEEKNSAIGLSVSVGLGAIIFLINKLI